MSEDEAEYVPHPAAKKVAAKNPHPVHVKAEEHEKNRKVQTAAKKKTRRRMNGNNVRISDLPEFAQAKWRQTFLPTLYDKFFASDQPFDGFCRGSDKFIALLQRIVEDVYPDSDYEVTSADSIHFLVRFHCYIHQFLTDHMFLYPRRIIESTKSDPA